MSGISTHILDTTRGQPAAGVAVILEHLGGDGRAVRIAEGSTDAEGRVQQLIPTDFDFVAGAYQLTFETGPYFAALRIASFYPRVTVLFNVNDSTAHYHVPLLLSAFGYSTYRGT